MGNMWDQEEGSKLKSVWLSGVAADLEGKGSWALTEILAPNHHSLFPMTMLVTLLQNKLWKR